MDGKIVDLRKSTAVSRSNNNKLINPNDIVISIDDDSDDNETQMNATNANNDIINEVMKNDNMHQLELVAKVDRMKRKAGEQLKCVLNNNVLSTPERKKVKKNATSAIQSYQKAKKNGTCDDLLELTELLFSKSPMVRNSL